MTKPTPTITEREERLWHDLAALTREQSRLVQEIVALTFAAADPRAIPVGALVEPDEAPPVGDPDDDAPTTRGRAESDDGTSLDALDALDAHPLPTVHAVPTVPTPANDDGGQP